MPPENNSVEILVDNSASVFLYSRELRARSSAGSPEVEAFATKNPTSRERRSRTMARKKKEEPKRKKEMERKEERKMERKGKR